MIVCGCTRQNLHFKVHKARCLPRNLHIKIHIAQPCQGDSQQEMPERSFRSRLRLPPIPENEPHVQKSQSTAPATKSEHRRKAAPISFWTTKRHGFPGAWLHQKTLTTKTGPGIDNGKGCTELRTVKVLAAQARSTNGGWA